MQGIKIAAIAVITIANGSFPPNSLATQFLPQLIVLPQTITPAEPGPGFNQAFLAAAFILGQAMNYDIQVKGGTPDLPPYYNTGQISFALRKAIQTQQEANELAQTIELVLPPDGSPSPTFETIQQDPQKVQQTYNLQNLLERFAYSETGITNIVAAIDTCPNAIYPYAGSGYSIEAEFRESLIQSVKEARQHIIPQ
jgi:hypothetical protein